MFWSTKPDSSNSSQLWCTAFWGPSGAANGLLRLSLDGQLSTIFSCPGNGSRLSRCRTGCCCIPKSHFSLSQNSHLFFFLPPSDRSPGLSQRGNRKLTSSEAAGVSHIRSISTARLLFCFFSLSLSPCCTCAPSRLGNKCGNVREHMWVEHTFARCTCAHASVRSWSSEISLPPVPQQGRALRSAQALPHNNKHAVGQMFIWQRCSLCSMVIAGILAQPIQPFHWVHQFLRDSRSILTVGVIHYKKCWLVLSKPT